MQEFIVSTLEDENDSNHDAGDLSLREAIAIADPGATITFDSSLTDGTIKLVLGELAIDKDLTIQGLGADNLTVDGSFLRGEFGSFISSRVFNINDGDDATSSNVAIEGITITGGDLVFADSNGGAGILNHENLSLNSSIVRDNNAPGRLGAGILNRGNLVVNSSSITNNNAGYRGGVSGAGFGGGIANAGTAKIVNSTIADNIASIGGGIDSGGPLEISNSTITSNTADLSSFSEGIGNGISGSATITSSIVAGNGIRDFGGSGEKAVVTSGGNNLIGIGDGTTGLIDGVNGDLVGTSENPIDPKLGKLQNNGGATQTKKLLEGSPAIDTGSNPDDLVTDQRGEGFNRTVGDETDIGAFEVQDDGENGGGGNPGNLVVSTLKDEKDSDFSEGDLSLREAIANSKEGDTITFDSSLSGGSIILSQGELLIDNSLNINGLGAKNLTIDGNNESRIFRVDDGIVDNQIKVLLTGLTIKNGRTGFGTRPDIDGGGLFNQENLLIVDSALVGNGAGNGGAIYNTGKLKFENSLVERTGDGTGPIYNDGGIASITNSTFANNNVPGISAIVNANGGELELTNSTITNNIGYGAAVFNSEDSTATVASTIIAGNKANLTENVGKEDISGNFISNGNNLIGTTTGASGFDDPSDIVGTADNPIDPQLGELQDNGGATLTQELLEGSPAIDTGSNPNNLETDQRGEGFDRTVGNGTDIGAFEVQTVATVPEIVGTAGGDVIDGTEGSDRILGLDGNDTIRSLGGNDTVQGDNGNDSLEGGVGDDFLEGLEGFDSLFGGDGNDTLDGGVGNDSLDGGAGNDQLLGLDGRDTLLGGIGSDTLEGGAGVDSLSGGEGDDRLLGQEDNDSLFGGDGNDFLDGGLGIDSLSGDAGDDRLFGLEDNDSLLGGNGNDLLDGGLGSDSLLGGDGNDTFVISANAATDTITDFSSGNDLIGLASEISFADLSFSGNNIILGTETIATLNGFDTTNLTESNFVQI